MWPGIADLFTLLVRTQPHVGAQVSHPSYSFSGEDSLMLKHMREYAARLLQQELGIRPPPRTAAAATSAGAAATAATLALGELGGGRRGLQAWMLSGATWNLESGWAEEQTACLSPERLPQPPPTP